MKLRKTVQIIRDKVKAVNYKELHNYGHFCFEDMKTIEFPEPLAEVLT